MVYVYNFNVTVEKYLHVLVLDYTAVAMTGNVGPVNPVNHTSWITVVTPSYRPRSVCNRCVIELFGDVLVLSCCPFDISVSIRAFVIGLSQISSFFLYIKTAFNRYSPLSYYVRHPGFIRNWNLLSSARLCLHHISSLLRYRTIPNLV